MAGADVGPRRARGDQEPPTQGPSATVGLIWRLRGRSTFDALRRRGRRRRSRHLAVTWLSDGRVPPEVGFAIGRAVGDAVTRNRLRRRLRAIVAELGAQGAVPAGAWLISAGATATDLSSADLREELADLLSTMDEGTGR